MDSDVFVKRLEAHDEAGEKFADAMRKSFPAIAPQITENAAVSFHGTIKGRDVVCTFEQLPEQSRQNPRAFSRHYDPTAPEVRERRKRLFERIDFAHSAESARELRVLAKVCPEQSR